MRATARACLDPAHGSHLLFASSEAASRAGRPADAAFPPIRAEQDPSSRWGGAGATRKTGLYRRRGRGSSTPIAVAVPHRARPPVMQPDRASPAEAIDPRPRGTATTLLGRSGTRGPEPSGLGVRRGFVEDSAVPIRRRSDQLRSRRIRRRCGSCRRLPCSCGRTAHGARRGSHPNGPLARVSPGP
jgi:hypothetical protein